MPERATTIQIPRWIQLVGLPLLLVLARVVASAVRQVVFLFAFVASLVIAIASIATVAVSHTRKAANRVDDYFKVLHGQSGRTDAERYVDRLQRWLSTHVRTAPTESPEDPPAAAVR